MSYLCRYYNEYRLNFYAQRLNKKKKSPFFFTFVLYLDFYSKTIQKPANIIKIPNPCLMPFFNYSQSKTELFVYKLPIVRFKKSVKKSYLWALFRFVLLSLFLFLFFWARYFFTI